MFRRIKKYIWVALEALVKSSVREVLLELFLERVKTDETFEQQQLHIGDMTLDIKRMFWDSERCPFTPENWDEYGFQVFSQFNEDGLIQYLIEHVEIENKTFVEFGVEDYSESNTRYLLLHNDWIGLVMDGCSENMKKVQRRSLYSKNTITAKSAFITKDNINQLISENGFTGDIGLLSVDIDGVDYWVLDAINCIKPRILICEFNPIFGAKEKVTVPYKEDFYRTDVHYSNLYWGASLGAFTKLAKGKGYKLVCINNKGHNAFFVKEDIKNSVPEVSVEEAFRDVKIRESRDEKWNLTFLSLAQGRELIGDLEVIDIDSGKSKKIRDLQI